MKPIYTLNLDDGIYKLQMNNILKSLARFGAVENTNFIDADGFLIDRIPSNQTTSTSYFVIKIIYDEDVIYFVYDQTNFYLQGFMLASEPIYYYFSDAVFGQNFSDSRLNISTRTSLGFVSSYETLMPGRTDVNVDNSEMLAAFSNLLSVGQMKNYESLKKSLLIIILMTAESLRFSSVQNEVDSMLNDPNHTVSWRYLADLFLKNWGAYSREFYNGNIQSAIKCLIVLCFNKWNS